MITKTPRKMKITGNDIFSLDTIWFNDRYHNIGDRTYETFTNYLSRVVFETEPKMEILIPSNSRVIVTFNLFNPERSYDTIHIKAKLKTDDGDRATDLMISKKRQTLKVKVIDIYNNYRWVYIKVKDIYVEVKRDLKGGDSFDFVEEY